MKVKTVINAKIIFETDKYQSLYYSPGSENKILTVNEIAEIMRAGKYELSEVLRNDLMNDQELYLIVKHKPDENEKRNK